MKSILLCCLLVLAVYADDTWEAYKAKYGKKYNPAEEGKHKAQYDKTHAKIRAHNKRYKDGKESFSMALTEFCDMLPEEKAAHLGHRHQPEGRGIRQADEELTGGDEDSLPTDYDLRTSECMPAIKAQLECGNCWAFAAVTPIEYQHCMKGNDLVTLSEQQVTDCTYAPPRDGCQGGDHREAWDMIYSRGGLAPSSAYPFVSGPGGKGKACTFSSSKVLVQLANGVGTHTPQQNETAMQTALVNHGPLSFGYHVADNFYYYSTGVYSDSTCPKEYNTLNHEMVIVGYGESDDTPYWIVRNTWGTGWGQAGYAFVKRGTNECGISMDAGYPTIA